eukprot:4179269-Prymnesium_polylepis.2
MAIVNGAPPAKSLPRSCTPQLEQHRYLVGRRVLFVPQQRAPQPLCLRQELEERRFAKARTLGAMLDRDASRARKLGPD